ncbi:TRAP transporter large permease [Lawsonibacter sp. OA9]|jgi:C4-dicarboxylate transporter DctM subunit|uniref:TRAP transporter large permease n=1 Tax=Flintibacter hominis TaxID=2763048 RepID=A0A8J6MDW5_9FIRM|nr:MULTISPECIES: TRAP transporter large permease [Eubacteriales]SCH79378.1 Neu5Ac permease [uncultured Clostridium sp.]SCJ73646.1 Neu5Ac permease [uncultured Flavonifractor sp.]MBC5723711.1 TRAP transporter large permease [Flintibacter hominis]MCH1978624.1 TRAP transporter large permease [Lawsonibacter sp. OA9]MCU6704296.1 TRAP transporter large permease [Muriventricola aceti]
MNILLLFGVFFVLIMLSVPIGVALGVATSLTICLTSNIGPVMVAQKAFTGLDSFTLIAIPFFMLAGNLMALGGIARRIVNLADAAVGKFTGGLGMATVIGCMFFAAISGSGPATVTAMGSIMLPEMEKRGYDRAFSTGLTATAGTIGVIIPPSIPFVIYGVASGTSVGDMFKAGFIPGILIGIGLMIVCWVISKKRGYKGIERTKNDESFLKVFLDSLPALMAPVIILGGIYGGIFTPTEAAVVATVYSLFVGKFVYHELTWKIVYESYRSTADMNGFTGLALGFSMSFAAYLTMEQIPAKVANVVLSAVSSKIAIIALIIVILLVVGCFVDNISSCLILTPVFLPMVKAVGMDPVHFGIMMTVALAIGFVTPPYGVNLFVASAVAKLKIEEVSKAAIPFLAAMFVCLLLIAYIEPISMALVWLLS